jgi:uncharacterized protein YozE (UPF0346 family)
MRTVHADCDCLDAQGVSSPAPAFLVGDSLWTPGTISCEPLSGLRLRPDRDATILAIYLLFAGEGVTDTWNSWTRAPRAPGDTTVELQVDGQVRAMQCRSEPLDRRSLPIRQQCIFPATVMTLIPGQPIHDARELLLRIPQGPHLLGRILLGAERLDIQGAHRLLLPQRLDFPPTRAQLDKRGDVLAQQLLSQLGSNGEPTLADIARLALPFRGGALLGTVEGPIAYQNWDGGLLFREYGIEGCDRTHHRLSTRWLGPSLASCDQRLRRGYLPIGELQLIGTTGARMTQIAFVDLDGNLRARSTLYGLPAEEAIEDELAQCGLVPSENQKRAKAQVVFPIQTSVSDETLRLMTRTGSRRVQRSNDHILIEVTIPLAEHSPQRSFDEALEQVETDCETYLASGSTLSIPEPTLDRLWRALLLHNRLFVRDGVMRYGLFPGVYDGGVFGVEEGWNIVALAQFGHADEAAVALRKTFFDPQFLSKSGQHHQYRNGLALTYAAELFGLTGNRELLNELWPQIAESAEWICESLRSTQFLVDGQRPTHYGLMPKHTYGGDLTEPAYSLYGSSTCWRGIRDAAQLATVMQDRRSHTWLAVAAEARRNLHSAAERSYRKDGKPPYLPFRTDDSGPVPSAADYHQLFASLVLETALFGWHGRWSHEITDYLEQTGRQVLQVARFDQWFGRLGVDAEYSRGTQLCAIHRREFSRFYLGLLGQVGLSCDPSTFVSPETAIVLFEQHEWNDRMRTLAEQPSRCDSDPCSAGTAVMLQYLRMLFVCEERDEDDVPTGTLLIGAPMPASFFAPGQHFAGTNLSTALGTISLRCESSQQEVVYFLRVRQPITVELFYFDSSQQHRSHKHRATRIDMEYTIRLPR